MRRRTFLLSLPAGAVVAAGLDLRQPTRAAAALPARDVTGGTTRLLPDPVGRSGSWQRLASGGWHAVAAADTNAVAVSPQWAGPVGRLATTVTVPTSSPHAVAGIVLRADADGTRGCVLAVDVNLRRLRLFDLATGRDLTAPVTAPLALGTTYPVTVVTNGSRTNATVGTTTIQAVDTTHAEGHVGLHVWNGTVDFGPLTGNLAGTNLAGLSGTTGWSLDGFGIQASAGASDVVLVGDEDVAGTELAALVVLRSTGVTAGLVVRGAADGTSGYLGLVDGAAQALRIVRIEDQEVLASCPLTVATGEVHRLRVRAEGSTISLFWQSDFLHPDGVKPALTATDAAHATGHVGLRARGGKATLQQVTLTGPVTTTWWTPVGSSRASRDRHGLDLRGQAVSQPVGADQVLALDADLRQASSLGLVLRAAPGSPSTTGVRVDLARSGAATATVVATGAVVARGPLPSGVFGRTSHVEATVAGTGLRLRVDATDVLSATVPAAADGADAVALSSDRALVQNLRLDPAAASHNGLYQPRYHHSQAASNTSDPNGLVHLQGEYHLFHQDRGRWAHAVSTDLLHWRQLPIAIDETSFGDSWSGSAVADTHDRSGLFGGGQGLVAFFTSYDQSRTNGAQTVRAATSADRGRTWTVLDRVVVPNPGPDGQWDFRDPKVTWDAARGRYVMVVSGGDHIRLYTSTNLLDWTARSTFGYGAWVDGGVWECPDLFPLPVAGTTATRWVLWWSTGAVRATNGSNARYVTGTFDGTTFTPDTPADVVLRSDLGRDFYAAMTFSDLPGDRRVQMAWMSNWDYAFAEPTGRFSGALCLPRELGLVDQPGVGLRLTQKPVDVTGLATGTQTVTDVALSDGRPWTRSGLSSFRIRLEVALPASGAASSVTLGVRQGGGVGTDLVWRDETLRLDRAHSGEVGFAQYFSGYNQAVWPSTTLAGERHVVIDAFVDASSVEVFRADGLGSITDEILPDPSATGLTVSAQSGAARIVSATITTLDAGLTPVAAAPVRPQASWPGTVRGGWGDATPVLGEWTTTAAGLTGSFDRDALRLSTRSRADVTLTATLVLGTPPDRGQMVGREAWPLHGRGGAVSFVLRSDATGANAYLLSLDPQLHVARVFVVTGGSFRTVAERSVSLVLGTPYAVRASAVGRHVSLAVDGVEVVAADDDTFTSGRWGLDVFGGVGAVQDLAVG